MSDIKQAIAQGRQSLNNITDNPQNEALILLEHATARRKEFLIAHSEETLEQDIYQNYLAYLQRRAAGEPIAYITQTKEFWSLSLDITPEVLIPRHETELVVETTLEIAKQKQNNTKLNILDLGTGSGCIAIALAKELPNASITACDISPSCIQLAEKNAEKFKLDNIQFIVSDWLNQVTKNDFDVIVSNPPYIAKGDTNTDHYVEEYEPEQALFSSNNGLADIEKIIQQAKSHLKPSATLLFEHGFQQASSVHELFNLNHFKNVMSFKDLQGQERVTKAQLA